MKEGYSRKTWPSIGAPEKNRRGALTLFSAFLFFVFSTLAMSMLYLTRLHIQLRASRKHQILCEYAVENGIKMVFHRLHEVLVPLNEPRIMNDSEYDDTAGDMRREGIETVNRNLGTADAYQQSESQQGLRWESGVSFSHESLEDRDIYVHSRYRAALSSSGTLENISLEKEAGLDIFFDFFAGHIPLSLVPFLIEEWDESTKSELKDPVSFDSSGWGLLPPAVHFPDQKLIPKRADHLLAEALKIRMFDPFDLKRSQLRESLGLEISDEPVPQGVYLIQDDLGLGGIYVEGQVEEMILAVEGDYQVVSLETSWGEWILKYSPLHSKTVFHAPGETRYFDMIPRGIIIVNGEIQSLGGGSMDASGEPVLTQEEISCLIQGTVMTILSPETINLSSHLLHQGLRWKGDVPYIDYSRSQLNILAAGEELFESVPSRGTISIDAAAPDNICLNASLTSGGEGFVINGRGKNVRILGSLQTGRFSPLGNSVRVFPDQRYLRDTEHLKDTLSSVYPLLLVSGLETGDWRQW
jgi:hypothetical protein